MSHQMSQRDQSNISVNVLGSTINSSLAVGKNAWINISNKDNSDILLNQLRSSSPTRKVAVPMPAQRIDRDTSSKSRREDGQKSPKSKANKKKSKHVY